MNNQENLFSTIPRLEWIFKDVVLINIQVDLRIEHKELVSAKYVAGSPVAINSDRCTCYSRGWKQAILTAISTPNFLDARTCNKQKQLYWQTCQATTHNEMPQHSTDLLDLGDGG
jgi:hypothetical protein